MSAIDSNVNLFKELPVAANEPSPRSERDQEAVNQHSSVADTSLKGH